MTPPSPYRATARRARPRQEPSPPPRRGRGRARRSARAARCGIGAEESVRREGCVARLLALPLLVSCLALGSPATTAQLAITEVISSATNRFGTIAIASGPDFW